MLLARELLLLIGSILLLNFVLADLAMPETIKTLDSSFPAAANVPKVRTKRGIFWDFFQKVFITKNLIVDQYTDTRNTLNDLYNMVNEQFSDPTNPKPTDRPRSTTERLKFSNEQSSSEEMTTTTEKVKISRYELGHILGRNFRGAKRLAKIEFDDSLNATQYNLMEYKAEWDRQFANSLGVEKKNKLKSLG